DIVNYFREWFMERRRPLFDHISEILRTKDEAAADAALRCLTFQLNEAFVLDVLNYNKKDVLSCLKFFDWAGRRPGFYHTRATFNAIFRIISKAKMMSLMLDFLQSYMKEKYCHKVRYHNILVIGYALAGRTETALYLFGEMRFMGVDLDEYAYHVLMNSLVEQGHFDMVQIIYKQIEERGFQRDVTHSIMIKSLCKQKNFDEGADYLSSLLRENSSQLSGIAVGTFVDALCKDNQFERAARLVEKFQRSGSVSMDYSYSVWIRNLVNDGKLDRALEFLKDRQAVEGYVPDVFRYNMLICRLLRENRIEEVYDLLADMKEKRTLPDCTTMNAVVCFLCKAGWMDIALQLYESREDFALSVNFMAYNYLINTLLGDFNVEEAFRVLRNAMSQGYLPGDRIFSIILDSLRREGKLDKMKDLVQLTLDQNVVCSDSTYDKFISALCRAKRVEDGYLLHGLLNRSDRAARMGTYVDLINGFVESGRGDIAARLFVEMQEKGYRPMRALTRKVITALCKTSDPENEFFTLLEMQLRLHHRSSDCYHAFIDGAGHAGKPELARQVYLRMRTSGVEPSVKADILLLQSVIRGGNVGYAKHLFRYFTQTSHKRKFWAVMIVGLCKAKKPDDASEIFDEMKWKGLVPSIECYEELIKLYCELRKYEKAINLVNDMTGRGRPISSFIGNVFLWHSLLTWDVCYVWSYLTRKGFSTPPCRTLGHVVSIFSGFVGDKYGEDELEKLIEQCFYMDTYTNNILLRRIGMSGGADEVCRYFDRMIQRGYVPNRWTYDIIVHGFVKDGRITEAKSWIEKMISRGFDLTEATKM
ncbi:hypothetical protein M569_11526, partial [Genlisea aurea]